ncbi:holin [Gordonia sp. ABSL49_1]|uniref:holin n=1 Tax=Gordonia sp. ABSL49_1 TaxID=2920941 RepID=UPI001F0EEE59|nr:holin [Gordonia sp. ABSL49_1]MCH5645176.1 holin [Gordonia sp. ABSL49_1]
MFSVSFWKDAGERAVKSAAQAAMLAVGGDTINVWSLDWVTVAGVGLGGGVLSLLTSLASERIGTKGTASAVSVER